MWTEVNGTSVTLSGSGPITAFVSNNFWHPDFVARLELRTSDYVTELPPDGNFSLLKPIPIEITPESGGRWIARFLVADIAMSGSDPSEAKEALVYNLLDTMELFVSEEANLIPVLQQSLDLLRQYIEVRD